MGDRFPINISTSDNGCEPLQLSKINYEKTNCNNLANSLISFLCTSGLIKRGSGCQKFTYSKYATQNSTKDYKSEPQRA